MTQQPQNATTKKWTKDIWALLIVNFAIFAAAFLVFDRQLPDVMPSHFDMNGNQDGSMPKWQFWLFYGGLGVLLPPAVAAMRFIDPRKENYARFEGFYKLLRWVISLFLQGLFITIILHGLGHSIPVHKVIAGALGALWVVIGNRMGQVRSNFFIGIRTPWTLVDENNWNRTHRLAAKLWVLAGLIMFVMAWFATGIWVTVLILVCVLGSSIVPVVYSCLLHRRANP